MRVFVLLLSALSHAKVVMYTRDHCPYSERARQYLRAHSVPFTDHVIKRGDPEPWKREMRISPDTTYPAVFINDKYMGGSDELKNIHIFE